MPGWFGRISRAADRCAPALDMPAEGVTIIVASRGLNRTRLTLGRRGIMRRGMTRRDFLQEAALTTAALGLGGDLLAACGATTTGSRLAPPALKRDSLTLVYAVDNFTPDFDPASYYVNSPAHLTRSMYEGLLSMKPGSATDTRPALATSYQASPDFATWTFTIRQGVSF